MISDMSEPCGEDDGSGPGAGGGAGVMRLLTSEPLVIFLKPDLIRTCCVSSFHTL